MRHFTYGDLRERVVLATYGSLAMIGDSEGRVTGQDLWLRDSITLVRDIKEDQGYVEWLSKNGLYLDADQDPIPPLSAKIVPHGTAYWEVVAEKPKPLVVQMKPSDPIDICPTFRTESIELRMQKVYTDSGLVCLSQRAGFDPWHRQWLVWRDGARCYRQRPRSRGTWGWYQESGYGISQPV